MTRPYACHNQPRPRIGDQYMVPNGWSDDGRLLRIGATVLDSVIDCRYDARGSDRRCVGCEHAYA